MSWNRIDEPVVQCTEAERNWMYEQRRLAMGACPNLTYQRLRRERSASGRHGAKLQVVRRDRDGSVLVRIRIEFEGMDEPYIRKLRVPAGLGSTSPRRIALRRARN